MEERIPWKVRFPEKAAAWRKKRRTEAPEVFQNQGKRHRVRLKQETIAAYGGACACCGEAELTFLTLDHVGGGGNKERRDLGIKSSLPIMRRLKRENWPQGQYRILCWNCQFGVQQPEGCPHSRI